MKALNAAKQRRAGIRTNDPSTVQAPPQMPPQTTSQKNLSNTLTIHQVVALFDKRLSVLEKTISTFMAASTDDTSLDMKMTSQSSSNNSQNLYDSMNQITHDMSELKFIVLNLQNNTNSIRQTLEKLLESTVDENQPQISLDETSSENPMELNNKSYKSKNYWEPVPPMTVNPIN